MGPLAWPLGWLDCCSLPATYGGWRKGCCLPLFPLLEEASGHGKDISIAAALSGHHDAHVCAPHAPLHDILKRGQLVSVHPVYAVHWAAVDGILQQPYALRLSCERPAAVLCSVVMWQEDRLTDQVSSPGRISQ